MLIKISALVHYEALMNSFGCLTSKINTRVVFSNSLYCAA